MKRASEQKTYIQSTNTHLLNILEDDYYMELGVVNMSVINKLLNNQVLELSQLIYYEILNSGIGKITDNQTSDIYYQLNYLLSLRQKSSSNKFFLTCGTLIHYDDLGNERYAPVVLIPIEIDYKNARVTCSGNAITNRLLVKLLSNKCFTDKESQNKFYDYYTSQPLYNIGQIDKIMVDLATQSNSSYSPVNYLTVCKVEYNDIVINKNFFNAERSMYESSSQEIIKTYFDTINAILPTNIEQKYAILKAAAGNNFAIDGRLGSGKTYTILNIIADCISKGKQVLYVNQDLDNVWDLEKNLKFLDLDHYVYNLTKSLRDINVPKMELPTILNQEFTDEDLNVVTKFEKGLDEKINGFTIRSLLEKLAELRNGGELLKPIDIEQNLQKHEIIKLYNDLIEIEKAIKVIGIYEENIWKKLYTSHNNITQKEIVDRAKNLYEKHTKLVSEIEVFCKKYKLTIPKSMNDLSRLISHVVSFSSIKPLSIWKDQKIRIEAINVLSEIQQMSDNNFSSLNYYEANISEDYKPGRARQILKELCGKYLKSRGAGLGEDVVYLDRLLTNDNKIQTYINQIELVLSKITETEKLICNIFEQNDIHKLIDSDLFNFFVLLSDFLGSHFILASWSNLAIEDTKGFIDIAVKVKNSYLKAKVLRDEFKHYLINDKDLTFEIIEEVLSNKNANNLLKKSFDSRKIKKEHQNINDLILIVKDYYAEIYPIVKNINVDGYNGTSTIEEQIESFIAFYELINKLDKPFFDLLKKLLIQKSNQVCLDMEHIYSVLKKFREESERIDNISLNLSEYKIGVSGEFGYLKKDDLANVKIYLTKVIKLKQELFKTFVNVNTVTTKLIAELIGYDEQYLSAQKTLDENSKEYKKLLGDNYNGFETVLGPIRQIFEHFSDFIIRLEEDANIEKLLEQEGLNNLIDDCLNLRDTYNEWITLFRSFSLCFKGGKNILQESSINDSTKLLCEFNNSLNHIGHILFINEVLKRCSLFKLNALTQVIENAKEGDLIANSYLLSSLNKIYNIAVREKPYILDFANYENVLEKYLKYEIDYCTKNILKLQSKDDRKNKNINSNITFTDYNKIVESQSKFTKVFLADLNIFNSSLNLEPFDLVIIDDGHLSSANKYTRITECRQCIVCGDKYFRRSIVNTLMQRINEGAIISYRNRYITMSSKFNNIWSNNNRYIYNFDAKIVTKMLNSITHFALTVVDFFVKNESHIINVVVGSENTRRLVYSEIVKVLENFYSGNEITEILCYNIRIINALDEGSRFVNDVIVYYNDFIDLEKNQKELIFKNFVVVSDGIYIYYVGSKIEENNNKIAKDINQTIGRANNHIKKTNGISKLLFEKLKSKDLKVREGFGYFDVIIEESNTVAVMIVGKATSEDFSLLDEYNYYYREYQRHKWIVEIIYVGDLINHFDDTVDEIIKLSKGSK